MISNTFVCECGCGIEFIKYSNGCDIYFFHNGILLDKIFTEPRMVNDSWNNYININEFSNWGDFWNYICNNCNNSNVIKHLHSNYKDIEIPDNARMELEFIW